MAPTPPRTTAQTAGAFATSALLAALSVLQRFPLGAQAAVGRGLGAVLHRLVGSRRRVARRNVALCFPEWSEARQHALVAEHFRWLGRSIVERALLWWAPEARLRGLIRVEGDIGLADRSDRPVMWLVPHFVGLDVAGVATQLFQRRWVVSIYQAQSNAVMDAAIRRGRLRFDQGEVFPRSDSAKPLIRAVRQGAAFFNLPDMDFGLRDAAFVPFFHHDAATLLAPSRLAKALDMIVQPVVAEVLPGGQGYVVRFGEAWTDFPSDDALADTARMNRWIESEIRRNPAQYLWVHRRFKTRPAGEGSLYG